MSTFDSIYGHGFVRVATAAPRITVADPRANTERVLGLAQRAHDERTALMLFPELGISAYAIDELFLQEALLGEVLRGLEAIREKSRELFTVLVVGAPLAAGDTIYNCAVVLHRGRVLGVVPKTYLPNYREYYEKRYFGTAAHALFDEMNLLGDRVPFGSRLLFRASDYPDFVFHVEICEDIWAPVPPSTFGAMAGATVLCNLSASNITIGKAADRLVLPDSQSRRCIAAYLYSAAGQGESTTDLAWDGQLAIFEHGVKLAEAERFGLEDNVISADIDLGRLRQERVRIGTFRDAALQHRAEVEKFRTVAFALAPPDEAVPLRRKVSRFPYMPDDPAALDRNCYEAYNIQVQGLLTRLESARIGKAVIGVSGGLDSTHALIVTARAFDRMGLPRTDIVGVTMPGFATGEGTKSNAWALMDALGISAREIDIRPMARQMLTDLGHPFGGGEPVYDVTFENVQAGLRTDYLFRLANQVGGLVVGTGDLSELGLGWCTYGVGDHMSHYNVNASVPKTLIQHLIRWCVGTNQYEPEVSRILESILGTVISPELVPADAADEIQSTEAKIGPYELQDFNLYYTVRYGLDPRKIAYLAHHAWADAAAGDWPPGIRDEDHRQYSLEQIVHWLDVFMRRFFVNQFKRSCVPNGPKVSSGGSLSPRGDWRAPSDASPALWLDAIAQLREELRTRP